MTRFINKLPYILCYLVAFALGIKQLREPDTWLHLVSGKWMLEHGALTTKDVFSFTIPGKHWVNVNWLYEIIIALLEKVTGAEGVILLQAIVNVTIVYLLFRIIKFFSTQLNQPISDFATVFAALLFLVLIEYNMNGGPEIISYLMCTLFLFILWRYPQMEWKNIWVIVLLQSIWANMHEGYSLGILVIGMSVIGSFLAYLLNRNKNYLQQTQRTVVLFIASALVILLNPNTIQLWQQPFMAQKLGWADNHSADAYSIFESAYWNLYTKWHILLLSVVCLFWITRIMIDKKQRDNQVLQSPVMLTYFALILLFSFLSLTNNKNITYAQIIFYPSIPVILVWLCNKAPLKIDPKPAFIIIVTASLFYISIVSNWYYKTTGSANRFGAHISMLHNPMGAANFIKENKLEGPAFSDSIASSYLLWSLYPDFKSYLDLRGNSVFPSPLINDYSAIEKSHEKYDSLDKKYNFNYAVFNNNQLPLLQQHFYWGEEYNVVYADPVSTIYLKANEKNYNFNHNFEIVKLFTWPQSSDDPAWAVLLTKLLNPMSSYTDEDEENQPLHAAKFYNQMQNYPVSVKILLPVITDFEDNAEANNALGLSLSGFAAMTDVKEERSRKMDSAKIYLQKAIQLNGKLPSAYAALADIAMMEGDFELAKKHYDKSLDLDNTSHSINHNAALASFYLLQKTNKILYRKDMIRYLEKAIELNPGYKRSYVYLAEAYWRDENIDAAKKNVLKAKRIDAQMYKEENVMLDELARKLKIQ